MGLASSIFTRQEKEPKISQQLRNAGVQWQQLRRSPRQLLRSYRSAMFGVNGEAVYCRCRCREGDDFVHSGQRALPTMKERSASVCLG